MFPTFPVRAASCAALLSLVACGGSASGCPEGAIRIEGLDVCFTSGTYLGPAETWEPPPSDPNFTLEDATFYAVDRTTLELEVAATAPFKAILLDLNGGIYSIDPMPPVVDLDPCNDLLPQVAGYACTPACVEACSCLTCPSSGQAEALEQGCAVNCSISDAEGMIGGGANATWADAKAFADVLYNGDPDFPELPGLASSTGCDASACEVETYTVHRFSFKHCIAEDFCGMNVGSIMAVGGPPESPTYTPQVFGKGSVSTNPRGSFEL